jgi:choline dehydrogenase-like flavoprotein
VTIVEGRHLDGDVEDSADVVVVGSGAAGAVVAAHLAEAGQRVIVLEEGGHQPLSAYRGYRPSETLRHMWRDGGMTATIGLGGSPLINVMMGECVGGSSMLTGGVCFRTPPAVHHEWAHALRLSELSEREMVPFYEDVERAVHVEEVPESMRSRSTSLFAEGALRNGHPLTPLRRNTRGCHGCGRCNFGCPEGAKMSVDRTYIPRALASGARLYSDFHAERVLSHGVRAIGVAGSVRDGPLRRRKARFVIHARRVVVAAGAYCTPLLLERAGLGKQSGQLGKNLTLHPGFRIMARFDERVEGWKGALQSAYCHTFEDEGINMVGMFVPPGILAATMPGIGEDHAERARLIPHLAVFGGMIHDQAGGSVAHVLGRRFIRYSMTPHDRAKVPRLLDLMARAYFAAGAREVFLPVYGLGGRDADAFRKLDLARIPPRKLECTSQHPLGTCRMGVSPEHSVVDGDGQTWELEELFVADGSILPSSLGVNPQETIMAMATRIAWKLRERPLPS